MSKLRKKERYLEALRLHEYGYNAKEIAEIMHIKINIASIWIQKGKTARYENMVPENFIKYNKCRICGAEIQVNLYKCEEDFLHVCEICTNNIFLNRV